MCAFGVQAKSRTFIENWFSADAFVLDFGQRGADSRGGSAAGYKYAM